MKPILFLLALVVIAVPALAQGDTTPTVFENIKVWVGIAITAYEAVVRLLPTKWNISLVDNAIKVIKAIISIIPNKATPDAKNVVRQGASGTTAHAQSAFSSTKDTKLVHKV